MQKHQYRIKSIKMGEIKEESVEKQSYKSNPEQIIQRHSRSGFRSIQISHEKKRKSFQQFIDFIDVATTTSVDILNRKNLRKRKRCEQMVISFDHAIRPIHRRTKTQEISINRFSSQKFEKPSISRTKIFTKGKVKLREQTIVQPQKEQKKCNSSLLLLKKIQIKNKLKESIQNFQCRPWTRRIQREQADENIQIPISLKYS